jgi:hypothetical protein
MDLRLQFYFVELLKLQGGELGVGVQPGSAAARGSSWCMCVRLGAPRLLSAAEVVAAKVLWLGALQE